MTRPSRPHPHATTMDNKTIVKQMIKRIADKHGIVGELHWTLQQRKNGDKTYIVFTMKPRFYNHAEAMTDFYNEVKTTGLDVKVIAPTHD